MERAEAVMERAVMGKAAAETTTTMVGAARREAARETEASAAQPEAEVEG